MDENIMLMPFIGENDNKIYVKGFEAGQIWTLMQSNYKFDNYLFHSENKNQIELMCKRFLYSYRIDFIDETWSSLFAELDKSKNN